MLGRELMLVLGARAPVGMTERISEQCPQTTNSILEMRRRCEEYTGRVGIAMALLPALYLAWELKVQCSQQVLERYQNPAVSMRPLQVVPHV